MDSLLLFNPFNSNFKYWRSSGGCKKFIQMGMTTGKRYAYHKGGRKYDKNGMEMETEGHEGRGEVGGEGRFGSSVGSMSGIRGGMGSFRRSRASMRD
jgi:hypothetical protein